jgi:hypothetical protein
LIEQLRLRGGAGSVLWGYRTVAVLGKWAVVRALPKDQKRSRPDEKLQPDRRKPPGWELHARVERVESFQIRQKPLYFTAPRKGGFWTFPVLETPTIDRGVLRAYLGQPER